MRSGTSAIRQSQQEAEGIRLWCASRKGKMTGASFLLISEFLKIFWPLIGLPHREGMGRPCVFTPIVVQRRNFTPRFGSRRPIKDQNIFKKFGDQKKREFWKLVASLCWCGYLASPSAQEGLSSSALSRFNCIHVMVIMCSHQQNWHRNVELKINTLKSCYQFLGGFTLWPWS